MIGLPESAVSCATSPAIPGRVNTSTCISVPATAAANVDVSASIVVRSPSIPSTYPSNVVWFPAVAAPVGRVEESTCTANVPAFVTAPAIVTVPLGITQRAPFASTLRPTASPSIGVRADSASSLIPIASVPVGVAPSAVSTAYCVPPPIPTLSASILTNSLLLASIANTPTSPASTVSVEKYPIAGVPESDPAVKAASSIEDVPDPPDTSTNNLCVVGSAQRTTGVLLSELLTASRVGTKLLSLFASAIILFIIYYYLLILPKLDSTFHAHLVIVS